MASTKASPMCIPSHSEPPTRNTSCKSLTGGTASSISGSYFGSVIHNRRRRSSAFGAASATSPASPQRLMTSAMTSRKLSRTRRLSEVARPVTSAGSAGAAKPAKSNRIPTTKEDITRSWVRLIVNQYLNKLEQPILTSEEQILNFEVINCKSGAGDFSCTYKIDVAVGHSNDSVESLSFIAKLLPQEDADRAHVFEAGLLEKEIEVYFEVLPSLQQFLRTQRSGDHSEIVEAHVPECIYGRHNMDGAGILVFNSGLQKGFAQFSDPEGLTRRELVLVVETMARIHASGKALLNAKTAKAVKNRYPYLTRDMYSNGMLKNELERQLQIYGDFLASGPDTSEMRVARSAFERLRASVSVADMLVGLKRQGPASLNTIIHGELWEKNILLRPSDSQVMVLDWKNAKVATPTLDLAFLIYSSTNVELLGDNGHLPFLEAYFRAFCATLDKLDGACVKPTFRELERDFRLSLRDALLQAICMLVAEMQYLDEMTASVTAGVAQAETLQLYERRAMNLLTGINVDLVASNPGSPEGTEFASSSPFAGASGTFGISLSSDEEM